MVKEAEHLRELVQRIENHPHRPALHADLQQNNVYNPFSEKFEGDGPRIGNVELFELCETTRKVQCSQCLLCSNQGIVYCTCGQCLIYSASRRNFDKLRLDAISILDYVMKALPMVLDTERPKYKEKTTRLGMRGRDAARMSKSQGDHFTGIHDRFLRDPVYCESQLAIGWSEQQCKEWDELSNGDHTYKLTPEERRRF